MCLYVFDGFCDLLCVLVLLEWSIWFKICARQPPQSQCIACVMMQWLVTCALLGFCLHLKGCANSGGSGQTKCRCNRRLESVLPKADDTPGRMLSSRRRRTMPTAEYSEVCCDDWDPGSTWTVEPYDPYDNDLGFSTTEFDLSGLWSSTTGESTTETWTTDTTTTIGWKQPQGPVYTLQKPG